MAQGIHPGKRPGHQALSQAGLVVTATLHRPKRQVREDRLEEGRARAREREREREREGGIKTGSETHTHTHTQRQRESERGRETERERERDTEKERAERGSHIHDVVDEVRFTEESMRGLIRTQSRRHQVPQQRL